MSTTLIQTFKPPKNRKSVPGRKAGNPWEKCTKPREEVERLCAENQGLVFRSLKIVLRKWNNVDPDPIVEAGQQVLWRCAMGFKPELGWKFSTYAMRAILNGMATRAKLEATRKRTIRACELNPRLHSPQGPSVLKQILADEDRERMIAWVRQALEDLEPRERRVVEARVLEDKTLQEVGEEIGVTRERVRQIEAVAFRTLVLRLKVLRDREASLPI